MTYKTMRSIFHEGSVPVEDELVTRHALPSTTMLGLHLGTHEAFVTMAPQVYELLLDAASLDKEIALLTAGLSPAALNAFRDTCLIDEIVLTNHIEGVHSTRKEISEVLEGLRRQDKRGRFAGLVRKYELLSSGQTISLESCNDIRALYDELVAKEVIEADPSSALDGALFRAGPVSVCDGSGRALHAGTQPEELIVSQLKKTLSALGNNAFHPLVRAAVFHFLFAYIHPFYDGNGRVSRFISSYLIAQSYESICGFMISTAIKENTGKYYRAFSACEHPLNYGDLTPFVIAFCELVVQAMESLRNSLEEKRALMEECGLRIHDERDIALAVASSTLYAPFGATPRQLSTEFGITRQTVYKRIGLLESQGLVSSQRVGRRTYYLMDFAALAQASNGGA